MTTMVHRTGREGPLHDPYSYDELMVVRTSAPAFDFPVRATLHDGLAVWCKVERKVGEKWEPYKDTKVTNKVEDVTRLFTYYAGVTPNVATKAFRELKNRRYTHPVCDENCRGKYAIEVNGMPGETLVMCEKCKHVFDVYFDRSCIE
jgi:hypothetical protein